jgi:NAD-dependent dihydropyrimidine dehydrogenase PreA subunit
MTRVPGLGKIADKMFFENDEMIVLPKDGVLETKPKRHQEEILPSRIVEYFINESKYHWIMNSCICRASAKCKDHPIELGCLFLGEAASNINPQLGRRVTKEEALKHVSQCREAGLVHVIGRNRMDTIWLGVKPGNRLLTICSCCNCCCFWKILPYLSSGISQKVTKMHGVEVVVTERCTGCGKCTEGICFVGAMKLENGKAKVGNECRGCGRCVSLCPNEAIRLSVMDEQFFEETIKKISLAVKV